MTTLRIAHVADYFMPALGYQESLLPKWHARHGHDVHVITGDRYADVPDYDKSWAPLLGPRHVGTSPEIWQDVRVHRLHAALEARSRLWLRRLDEAISQLQPDVLFGHGTTSPTAFALARIASRRGIPLMLDCHMLFTAMDQSASGRLFYRLLQSATRRLLVPSVDTFYGVANECCDFLLKAQGVPAEKVRSLPLGLDPEVFAPDVAAAASIRERLGIANQDILLMQTGKLTRDKGPHLLVRAASPIMAVDSRVHLAMVGGGDPTYMAEVRRPLREIGLLDRLHEIPLVAAAELSGYYTAADICVYPAASSLSSLEAAACGAAVVMTDLPAGRWRAEQGVGICYRTGDVDALGATIGMLVRSTENRISIQKRALESVAARFSYDSVAHQLEAHMTDVVQKTRVRVR